MRAASRAVTTARLPAPARATFALLLALTLAGGLAGCADIPVINEISGPIIVQGDVIDDAGRPANGAEVTLSVHDWEGGPVAPPLIYESTTTTDDQGRFVFRGVPEPTLLTFVDGGASVDMSLIAVDLDRKLAGAWSFTRQLEAGRWAGEPPTVEVPLASIVGF